MPRSLVVACLAAVAYAAAPSVVSAHVDTVSRSQANEINVFMSCVSFVPGSDTTLLRGVFGYENGTSSTITEPVGVGNFTSPGNINRGQPETFLPGFHPFAFATSFVLNGGATQITWFLRGNTAQIIHPDGYPNHTIPPCGTFSAGDWRPGTTYRLFDVVRHDGASWIAMDNVDTSEPGTDPGWQPFADAGPQGPVGPSGPQGLDGPSGAVGPAGPTGTSGAAGTPGSQGAAGTSGPPAGAIQPPAAFFPSPITWSFSSKGRWRIVDPHVTPASVITIQYVGRGGGKPTSISEQTAGSFIASGTPRGRFRYVVYNPPSS